MFARFFAPAMMLSCLLVLVVAALAQTTDQIDWNRAQQLHQRFVRGEKLTEEEQAYHDRAAKALQAKENSQQPAKPPVGLRPLSDMTASDHYKGQDGGLYGGGKNEPPEKHLQVAIARSKLIRPLDAEGKPAADGKIVLISVGMSNTTHGVLGLRATRQRRSRPSPRRSSLSMALRVARRRTHGQIRALAIRGRYSTSDSGRQASPPRRCKWRG